MDKELRRGIMARYARFHDYAEASHGHNDMNHEDIQLWPL